MFYSAGGPRATAGFSLELVNIATSIDPSIKWSASAQPINVVSLVFATILARVQMQNKQRSRGSPAQLGSESARPLRLYTASEISERRRLLLSTQRRSSGFRLRFYLE